MLSLFTDLRMLLVLFLLAAFVLVGGNVMQAGNYNRPVNPDSWRRWGIDPPLPGLPPAARGAERQGQARQYITDLHVTYPENDCGHNTWFALQWKGESDCVPKNVFSKDCIKRWIGEYTKRYWRKVWREEGLLETDIAARLAQEGIAWGGVVGIYDEVLKDLIENTITCAGAP